MSEDAEVPSDSSSSSRSRPDSGDEAGFLRFDHPVRELPRLLDAFELPSDGEEEPRETIEKTEAPGERARRVRRRALLTLAATAGLFLILQLTGVLPGAFTVHMPPLVFAALVVVGGSAPRVPKGTPQFQNPLNQGWMAGLFLSVIAGVFLEFADLPGPEVDRFWLGMYEGLGALAFLALVVWIFATPKRGARAAQPPGEAEETPEAAVAACREFLAAIGRNAPRGAQATGWLDLTGPEKRHKLVRKDRKGRLYRDVWWRLRLPWEDGVRLRLAGVEEIEIKQDSRFRERTYRLLANLAVDPRRWRTEEKALADELIGSLTVETFEVTPSRVSVRATSEAQAFLPDDLTRLIKILEERIQPVPAAGAVDEAPAGGAV